MAELVLKTPKIWLHATDITRHADQLTLEYGAEMLKSNRFGDTSMKKTPGLLLTSLKVSGAWDTGSDSPLFTNLGAERVCSVAVEEGTEGKRAYSFVSTRNDYSFGGAHGEILPFSIMHESRGERLLRGTILGVGTKTTTGNGAAYNLGAVGENQKIYAALHVTSVSGTSPTLDVTIESDDAQGFGSPITRMTFTRATAMTAEWLTPIAGPITDNWWRARWVIGGMSASFTIAVIFGFMTNV